MADAVVSAADPRTDAVTRAVYMFCPNLVDGCISSSAFECADRARL